MNDRIIKNILPIFIFTWGFSFAQFNTLMPMQPKKSEQSKIVENPKEEIKSKEKKELLKEPFFLNLNLQQVAEL